MIILILEIENTALNRSLLQKFVNILINSSFVLQIIVCVLSKLIIMRLGIDLGQVVVKLIETELILLKGDISSSYLSN